MNSRRLSAIRILVGAVAAASATASLAGSKDQVVSTPSIEQLATSSASTPSEHTMLASYFRQKAAELRVQASRHRNGGPSLSSKSLSAPAIRQRIENQSRREAMIAAEYEKMAAEHDALASMGS